MESEKLRMRKNTDKKTDVAFMFEHNPNLRNDDVIFMDDNKMILLTLEPESGGYNHFQKFHENKENIFPLSVKIGHNLGNLHRPIKVTKNQVIFPLQAETELEMLKKMFSSFNKFLDIQSDKMIFEPDEEDQIFMNTRISNKIDDIDNSNMNHHVDDDDVTTSVRSTCR